MIVYVCDLIKLNLQPLDGIFSSLCGLSKIITTSYFAKAPNYDTIPVPYNDDDVFNNNSNKSLSLIPKEKGISAIGYFEENGPITMLSKQDSLYSCGLNFVCWYNRNYFPNQNIESVLPSKIMSLLVNAKGTNTYIQSLMVKDARMISVEDSFGIFRKYSLLMAKQNLLANPYGFFSINLTVNFILNDNCIPEISIQQPAC